MILVLFPSPLRVVGFVSRRPIRTAARERASFRCDPPETYRYTKEDRRRPQDVALLCRSNRQIRPPSYRWRMRGKFFSVWFLNRF